MHFCDVRLFHSAMLIAKMNTTNHIFSIVYIINIIIVLIGVILVSSECKAIKPKILTKSILTHFIGAVFTSFVMSQETTINTTFDVERAKHFHAYTKYESKLQRNVDFSKSQVLRLRFTI